jgi:hypothetical protein
MTIRLKCPSATCQKVLIVKEELAGKRVRCPACKTSVSVPAPIAPPPDLEAFAAAAFTEDPAAKAAPASAPPPASSQTIDFTCDYCEAQLHLPGDQGGKQVPCPECKRIIKVPALKVEKAKDWRDVEKKGPAFARRDEPEKPLGAWDVSRGKVSQDALEEAGVITEPEEPRTLKERLRLPLYIAAGVGLVVLAWWAYSAFVSQSAQKRALDAALAAVEPKDGKPKVGPAHAAEVLRGAGEFHLRARKGELARKYFAKARAAFLQGKTEVAGLERDFQLADLAVSQTGLGGKGDDLLDRERLPWEETAEELYQTLRAIASPDVQVLAMRAVAQKLREHGEKGRAAGLANRLAKSPRIVGKGAKASATVSPLPAEAVALILDTDKADAAEDILPAPRDKGPIDALARVGYAQGKALQGNFAEALAYVRRPGPARDRLQAALAVGEVALSQGKTEQAKESAEEAVTASLEAAKAGQLAPVLGLQVVRLTARVGLGDPKLRADGLTDKAARARAHLELLRVELERLAKTGTAAGTKLVDETFKDKDTLAYALAQEAVARHDSRLGQRGEVQETAETLEERLRPFVQIGLALGIQDTLQ